MHIRTFALVAAVITALASTTLTTTTLASPARASLAQAAPQAPPIKDAPTGQQTAADWPQTVTGNGRTFQVYEPLFSSMAGDQVGLSAGIRRITAGAPAPGTGAVPDPASIGTATIMAQAVPADFDGELEINNFQVQSLVFGDTPAAQAEIDALQQAIGAKAISITRTALMQDMQLENARGSGTPDLGSFVPRFRVEQRPTVLIPIDSDPVFRDLGQTGWRAVQNTPFILLQARDGSFNVRLGDSTWMSSMNMSSGYAPAAAPPPEVIEALGQPPALPRGARVSAQRSSSAGKAPAVAPGASAPAPPAGAGAAPDRTAIASAPGVATATSRTPPQVLVTTHPTVLISIAGAPALQELIPGVQSVTNTASVLLRTPEGPAWWTLASGRWFRAADLAGPWTLVAATDIPAIFIKLPADAKHTAAKASIPGTPESIAAVAAANETRTVTIARAAAQCTVTSNGNPMWGAVDGTLLRACQNCSQPVIECDRRLYCCDNAVWFSADSFDGPWVLCDAPPDAIYQISAYSTVAAATFVEVVASTPDAVTFGYSPGYLGTYVSDGVVVYGNGYDQQGMALPNGAFQPVPQTFAMSNAFDPDTGTFAPPAEGDFGGDQPAVQPQYLVDGYIGWGWCPGWTTALGWGCEHPEWWDHWGTWWNNWNPYWNHWWDDHHIWQRERQVQLDQRTAERQEQREEAAAATRQRQIGEEEAAWRDRQAAEARAAYDRQAAARAEEARFRDMRNQEQIAQDRAAREQAAARARSGPTAQPGTMLWWYEYYNDYSHGYLSRAGVFHDPRYGAAGPPR